MPPPHHSATPEIPLPITAIKEASDERHKTFMSLSWQGWLQAGTVLVFVMGFFYSMRGDIALNKQRIDQHEVEIKTLQDANDKERERYDRILDKIDHLSENVNKLIGKMNNLP